MVDYDEKPVVKVRRRKDRSAEEKPTAEESFRICDDCKHSSIRYDPAKEEPVIVAVINQRVMSSEALSFPFWHLCKDKG